MLHASPATSAPHREDNHRAVQELAHFRYRLRKFLRLADGGEKIAGVTPRQRELLLGVAGFGSGGKATITGLAEFLQEKHNSVVELVDRAALSGLVRRESYPADRRVVLVSLTPRGQEAVARVAQVHREQMARLRVVFARLENAGLGVPRNGRLATGAAAQEPLRLDGLRQG